MKPILLVSLIVSSVLFMSRTVSAEDVAIDVTLNSESAASRAIPKDANLIDLATIDITAVAGNIYLRGFVLGSDVADGLKNFANIVIYDATTRYPVGEYPSQNADRARIEITPLTLSAPRTKTYIIRGTPTSSAAGVIRLGFQSLVLGNDGSVMQSNIPIYGNAMTLPGVLMSPSPTPTPAPSATPVAPQFRDLASLGLHEGDTVSAIGSDDPDIYIANEWGYKRLFLNPVIFGFYGHLGGFSQVKTISAQTRAVLTTSSLLRNCETNDLKVYSVQVTGEDTGTLHWVNTSGAQALQDDPDFFKKIFCINSHEFNWYSKGSEYSSVLQVSSYTR